jgi:hypothetical protein
VLVSVRLTCALGTTAFVVSVMVPRIVPLSVCPWRQAQKLMNNVAVRPRKAVQRVGLGVHIL